MLPLLLSLQVKPRQPAQILLAYCLVYGGSPPDSLSIVVCGVGPPISFRFDVSDYHVFDRLWQAWNFPRYVGLPTSPRFTEMLQNCLGFVGFHTIRHHIVDVHYDCSSKLQIILRFYSLFRHGLRYVFRVSAFELSSEKVAQPPFNEWNYPSEKEKPYSPARSPEANSRAFANWTSIEAIVDEMLQVFRHSDLSHQPVLVSVHPC